MIRESDLDKIIYDELQNIREIAQENCRRIDADFRRWFVCDRSQCEKKGAKRTAERSKL